MLISRATRIARAVATEPARPATPRHRIYRSPAFSAAVATPITATSFLTYTMVHASVSAARCKLLPQRLIYGRRCKRCARYRLVRKPRCDERSRLCHLPCKCCLDLSRVGPAGHTFHQAGDTICSTCHNGKIAFGYDDPAACPGHRRPVQQLPYQYRGEFRQLHDGPRVGERGPLQLLPQRRVPRRRHKGALGTASYPNHVATNGWGAPATQARPQASRVGQVESTPIGEQHQLLNLPQRDHRAGDEDAPHIPSGAAQCSSCHTNTAASFTTYVMNHSSVSAVRCDACHNGSYTGEGSNGALGTASYLNHVATNGRDCVTCHASAASSFTSWAGAKYVHAASDTNCSSCETTPLALGLTTPPHIPVPQDSPVQRLPHQHGDELHHLHDDPFGGEHGALQLLSQRFLYLARHQRSAGYGLVCRPCGDDRTRLHHLPRQRGHHLHQLGGRRLPPTSRAIPIA